MHEKLENIAINIMQRQWVTQNPLPKDYLSPNESVFHLTVCNGFKMLLHVLLQWDKGYLLEEWVTDDDLSPELKPSDDNLAELRILKNKQLRKSCL